MVGTRIFSRFSTGSMLGAGFGILWMVFAAWGIIAISMMFLNNSISKYPQVDVDGRIIVTTYDQRTNQRTAVDVDDNDVPNPDSIVQSSNLMIVPPEWSGNSTNRLATRTFSFSDQGSPRTYWYFVLEPSTEDATTGYFEGYDSLTRKRVGYLTQKGFTQMKPARGDRFAVSQAEFERQNGLFSASGHTYPTISIPYGTSTYVQGMAFPPWVVYLWAKPSLLKVDLRERSIEEVFRSDEVIYVTRFYKQVALQKNEIVESNEVTDTDAVARPATAQKIMIAFQENDRLVLFDPKDRETSEMIIPERFRRLKQALTVYQTSRDNVAIISHRSGEWGSDSYYEAFRFDNAGKITERFERIAVTEATEWGIREQIGLAYVVVLPAPLFIGIFTFAVIPFTIPNSGDMTYMAALLEALSHLWLGILLLLGVSTYLAYITLKRERRFQSEYPMVSVAFVFLFGWFGYIGYRLHRRWPTEKTITPAEPNGTEIFQPAGTTEDAEAMQLAGSV